MSVNLNTSFDFKNNPSSAKSKIKTKAEIVAQKFLKETASAGKEKIFRDNLPTFSIARCQKKLSRLVEIKKITAKSWGDVSAIPECLDLIKKIENSHENIKIRNANIEEMLEDDRQSDWYRDLFEEFGFENINQDNIATWREQYHVNLKEGSVEENGHKIRDISQSDAFMFIKDIFISSGDSPLVSFDLIYRKSKKEQISIIENFKKKNEADLAKIKKWQIEVANYKSAILEKKIKTLQAYMDFYANSSVSD